MRANWGNSIEVVLQPYGKNYSVIITNPKNEIKEKEFRSKQTAANYAKSVALKIEKERPYHPESRNNTWVHLSGFNDNNGKLFGIKPGDDVYMVIKGKLVPIHKVP